MKERIKHILSAIGQSTYEREEVLALALLSALAGESLFMLGLPGVGKSMIARRLKKAFKDATVFEYLMSRFSTPDEIFGPVSISKLKDEDTYERITSGYLPEAEVIFLDEIWKAGPAIQNALLTVLNEKIFLNGNHEMALPTKALIAASNELPAEGEGLEALWDRFLIRYIVEPLQSKSHFASLIKGESESDISVEPLSKEEYEQIASGIRSVVVPDTIVDIIYEIRARLSEKNRQTEENEENAPDKFYVSDRRWKKAVAIMRASAFINDRSAVDVSDLLILGHILWNEDSQIPLIHDIISKEVVKAIFGQILEAKKSAKRHSVSKKKSEDYFTPDGTHYVISCDGSTLKFAIKDYEELLKSGNIKYASETLDERLVLHKNGVMSVRVSERGRVCINSYNYPLVTNIDHEITEKFFSTVSGEVDSSVNLLTHLCNENIFVHSAQIVARVREFARIYTERLAHD